VAAPRVGPVGLEPTTNGSRDSRAPPHTASTSNSSCGAGLLDLLNAHQLTPLFSTTCSTRRSCGLRRRRDHRDLGTSRPTSSSRSSSPRSAPLPSRAGPRPAVAVAEWLPAPTPVHRRAPLLRLRWWAIRTHRSVIIRSPAACEALAAAGARATSPSSATASIRQQGEPHPARTAATSSPARPGALHLAAVARGC
jgi:hypothetical protein